MRYAQGGGLTARERDAHERLRLVAAERFERGEKTAGVAADLRVTVRSVERWRRAWREGGKEGLRSKEPASLPKLSAGQFVRLEAELERGPLAHGFPDQRWTLKRIKLLIGRMFHLGYTVEGVWQLLRRNGWSWQEPSRRAVERHEPGIEMWKKEVWPRVEAPRRPSAPGSRSRTSPGSR